MNIDDFRRILTSFADEPADVDLSRGQLLIQIRDEIIAAKVTEHEGDLWITEDDGDRLRAFTWIVNRIARLPHLADRILSYVPEEVYFVTPSGKLLNQLATDPLGKEIRIDDAVQATCDVLSQGHAGSSSVLYLTSDAGEGKTTVINQLARLQASRYKRKESNWLLLPVSLGGRPFLRFDDVVVAELVNKLRFQLFYYQAFLELVRLRVVIPAFDGFEEMFVEGSTGEALSALGNLMSDLASSGAVLIAARKAYFEYHSFSTQAKLFDAIGDDSVSFARLALDRWSRDQFLQYANKRALPAAADVYDKVATRLDSEHPLLTRAVLVNRLVDVALESDGVDVLLSHLGHDPGDYFYQFVDTIVEREANLKWIDRSGDPHIPLLTVDEHHELLALIAKEMWITAANALRLDYLDLVAQMFAEEKAKPAHLIRQIQERLHQHSLLTTASGPTLLISFDHEDFRRFFLGQALGEMLMRAPVQEMTTFLGIATLSWSAADAALNFVRRMGGDLDSVRSKLGEVSRGSTGTSYTKENCGALISCAIESHDLETMPVNQVAFPPDSLKGRRYRNVRFEECEFQPSSTAGTQLVQCTFVGCTFHRLELAKDLRVEQSELENCTVMSVVRIEDETAVFDPRSIKQYLTAAGFVVGDATDGQPESTAPIVEPDHDTRIAEHVLRIFMRATHINEEVFRQKLGTRASDFFQVVLPKMLDAQVLCETSYLGAGKQRRFRLGVAMKNIDGAVPATVSSLDDFLKRVREGTSS